MDGREDSFSVIVPAHNEEWAIAAGLEAVREAAATTGREFEIVVVDDGSTDGTAAAVDESQYRLVRLPVNVGYGAALKRGARAARHDILVIIDADGTYPAERLGELLAALAGAEMAVGARTGGAVRIPLARRPAKWAIGRLANFLSGVAIPDLNSGFRAVRRELWERYEAYYPEGFSLTTSITLAALTNGERVAYVPIDYHARVGRSKIRPVRDTVNFITLILRMVVYFRPLKVFVPASLLLILAAAAVGVATKLSGRFMDVTTTILFVTGLQMLAMGMLADLITKRLK